MYIKKIRKKEVKISGKHRVIDVDKTVPYQTTLTVIRINYFFNVYRTDCIKTMVRKHVNDISIVSAYNNCTVGIMMDFDFSYTTEKIARRTLTTYLKNYSLNKRLRKNESSSIFTKPVE